MIPSLVSILSIVVDSFHEATPLVILALSVVLTWQLLKALFSFIKESAKLIALVALLLALNTALNRKDDFKPLKDLELQSYAKKGLSTLEEFVEKASFEELLMANMQKFDAITAEKKI